MANVNNGSWQSLYYPFGARMDATGDDNKYTFTGKEYDDESSLHYYWNRYYDSELGRFISVDPMWQKYPTLTSYQYCNNNPITHVDPTGLDWYVCDSSGALQWYNGKYEDGNIPEGFSYLGNDSYFGKILESKLGFYKDNNIESINLTVDQSNSLVSNYGFNMVETQNFIYDETSILSYVMGNEHGSVEMRDFITTERTVINESYSYVPSGYVPSLSEIHHRNIQLGQFSKFSVRQRISWHKGNIATRLLYSAGIITTTPSFHPNSQFSSISVFPNWGSYKGNIRRPKH